MLNPYRLYAFGFYQVKTYKFITLHPAMLQHPQAPGPVLAH
jgi:hypothetical protein